MMLLVAAAASGQNDPDYSAKVARPAYPPNSRHVLIDEGHNNAFTRKDGRGLPLIALLEADGYRVTTHGATLDDSVLRDVDVLLVAAARGVDPGLMQINGGALPDSAIHRPAYARSEIDAIERWVRAGGAILIAAEHYPMGRAMSSLAARFGVVLQDGYLADTANLARFALPDSIQPGSINESNIVLSREAGLLTSHPITQGRDSTEMVSRVVLGGTSLCGPRGARTLFAISRTAEQRIAAGTPGENPKLGCAQGIAFTHGAGRVVVLGDANWFVSAQVRRYGSKQVRLGLSTTETQNRQFTLNVMHWLSRVLP